MATTISPATEDVMRLLEDVKRRHHPSILDASVAVLFKGVKPFSSDGRFNWGQTKKFTPSAKIWHHPDNVYDFEITIPEDAWHVILTEYQREALLDLHLTRCTVEFVPAEKERDGKKKKDKDKWGRIKFTDEVRLDENTGLPIWKVLPLDLFVYAENSRRYGLWHEDLKYFKDAVAHAPADCPDAPGMYEEEEEQDPNDMFVQAARKGTLVANADVVFHVNPDGDRRLDGEGFDA